MSTLPGHTQLTRTPFIEGIMESVADWYSRNLASETAKGKLERARQGLQNNGPPFGYDKIGEGVLVVNPQEAEGVRLAFESHAAIERMDFRWDHGFITDKDEYVEKRLALQAALEQLTPIPDEDLVFAADVLDHFKERWEAAGDNPNEQEYLLKLLLVRVWAKDGQIVSLSLRPDFHVTAGLDAKRPTEIAVNLEGDSYRSGSDGGRPPTCIRLLTFFPRDVTASCFRDGNVSVALAA